MSLLVTNIPSTPKTYQIFYNIFFSVNHSESNTVRLKYSVKHLLTFTDNDVNLTAGSSDGTRVTTRPGCNRKEVIY